MPLTISQGTSLSFNFYPSGTYNQRLLGWNPLCHKSSRIAVILLMGCKTPINQTCRKMEGGNVLFNDALNTFYLRLYGIGHMVKDHSDSERGNPLPPHRLLFPISSKGSFICTSLRQDNTYHSLCYTSHGALAGM